ncbi:MAG TPA: DUF456 domain-containing protein [Anaerolineales bacterium]|nr:DUF456 domain-containing protein [Anaerolineales bacterium]
MIDPTTLGEALLQALTLGIMLIGLFGLLIPVFPGLLIMWLAVLLYAVLESAGGRMGWPQWTLFAAITGLMIAGNFVDNIIIARKMRDRAIPWMSIGLAMVTGFFASIAFTPLIGIVAAPLALFGAEWLRLRRGRMAFASARNYMVAWGWSFAAIFGIGLLMIGLWIMWARVR